MSLPKVASLEVLEDECVLEGASGRLLEAIEPRSDTGIVDFRSGSGGGGMFSEGFEFAVLRILEGVKDDCADE